ncbi:ATPase associated with various cellular activities family protein [Lyngbya aestuarii BL J]|uniref:ATPase associated with various cellular activities family protein n=1 Tax=Lyngbya aestuarii BL J TaxID=1348334 RepID=U7QDZ9_9CYAN|nr:ATP-binding protein [Lyngbya aestuarii]ERT06088.1 ATPase associated with various cellular activities family protein [Lyngbya aestuarii BL J]
MKAELLKRLFRAIASSDSIAIDKLVHLVIEEERNKGHMRLADQLENITKKSNNNQVASHTAESLQTLSELPTSKRLNSPLVTIIPREKLRHHMVLSQSIEKRFHRIEKEYVARDRLAHYGLRYRQKILLYGPPGCGKNLGAERLAWNLGLPLVKVRFDAMVSSYLGETASNLRLVFDKANESPCLLFLDECDSIAKSREDTQEVGEIKRVVNTFLQILDEYEPNSGLLVAATNLNQSLDTALWRRFDDMILVPKPGENELQEILKQTLSALEVGSVNWTVITKQMNNFSAAQAVKVAQDAAKRAILEREELVIQEHLEDAIEEIKAYTS